MTNAARFYLGYIKARETEDYLSKTLLSIISARQERSDKATVSVLYALAVELNILQRILVSHFDIPDEVYAELRRKARAEVAVSRKGAQIESVQAQMFGGDTGWPCCRCRPYAGRGRPLPWKRASPSKSTPADTQ